MAACGGFRLEMEREDQAKKVLPIQLFSLALKGLMPTMKKCNIIEVDFEIGFDADEYDDIYCSLGEMPKKVAEVFPNFNSYCIEQTESYGVAANSEATMKNGEFLCIAGDSDGNFGKKAIGHIIDGNVVLAEENIDIDEVMQTLFEEE